jgi:PqqD family protein of HPr-rel-A system
MELVQTSYKPALRPTIEFRVLDDLSSVAVDPESGEAHALTPVATAIIERCDGSLTAREIVADIVEIFDCSPGQAEKDVLAFLDDLKTRQLVDW